MGRKPNQLILEFFERGQKLEDASNRYQHTCKACGEKFPKGRIDSLTTHLVKKCPAISLRDRQKALLQLNDLPDLPDGSRTRGAAMGAAAAAAAGVGADGQRVEGLGMALGNRNWTALETLAEVSRQIDLSEKGDGQGGRKDSTGARARTEEPARVERFELQEQWTPDNPPLSYEARVQRDKKLLNQKLNTKREKSPNPASFLPDDTNTQGEAQGLSMEATTSIAAAAARFIPSMVDPQLLGDDVNGTQEGQQNSMQLDPDLNTNTSLPESFNQHQEAPQWPMLDGSGGNMYPDPEVQTHTFDAGNPLEPHHTANTFPRQIAMNAGMTTEFSAEYGNGKRPARPKVRGRFTASRRKEVQEVRKRGACIRCRMLKKPCSGESPCSTCRNVESARLWKQPCVRTRIADELDMYSAGLHAVLAYHDINRVKSRVKFRSSATQIEATHYPETTVYATFNGLWAQEMVLEDDNIDPSLSMPPDFQTENVTLRILDNDGDDLPMKVEAYMKRMYSVFFEREPSHFMNITLNTALQLSIEKQDGLLTRVLELWAIVHILVDHELRWTISLKTVATAETGTGPVIDDHNNAESYGMLHLQLNAAAEKKAAQISKNVLNDLERRLLQRSSTSSFETFLVALILLNCVEKSTWLFKSWEQDSFKARWPLDKTPLWYGSQGDRISDMLQMLLRMRGIPPKTYTRASDGLLATDGDQVAREYFEALQLRHDDVLDKQTNPQFDPANSRCYELRYCSKLLLPMS